VCDGCYEEIQALFDREAEGRELYACDLQIPATLRKPLPTCRKAPGGPMPCVNCKTKRARWDSIYCSERCKWQFMDSLSQEVA
jgi:hypothetical protein